MAIVVKYFASLREQLGRAEDAMDLAPGVTLDVAGVWHRCMDGAPLPEHVLAAVNFEYVEFDHAVEDGDEVAFFPPVTGG